MLRRAARHDSELPVTSGAVASVSGLPAAKVSGCQASKTILEIKFEREHVYAQCRHPMTQLDVAELADACLHFGDVALPPAQTFRQLLLGETGAEAHVR